jgi:cytochrome c
MQPLSHLSLAALALVASMLLAVGTAGAQAPASVADEKTAAPAESNAPDAAAPQEEEEERLDGWQNAHLIKSEAPGAVDADAAIMLARKNGCFRCHALDRVKTGPAFKSVAEGYRSDYAAGLKREDSHLTAGDMLVLNGVVDVHRVLRTNPPNDPVQLKNLIDWILSLK